MDQRDLSRSLRADYWPRLKAVGFETRTDRAAWRYTNDAVDVLDVWAVGANADACGCTPVSFSAMVASIPWFMPPPPTRTMKNGRARPRYPDCQLKLQLDKTLSQPWFTPFATPPRNTLPSFLAHRRALQSVLRIDRHDRPDIWFVKEDGSNLADVVADLWNVTERVGLPTLERLHDPCEVIAMVRDGTVVGNPDSMVARDIVHAALRACPPT